MMISLRFVVSDTQKKLGRSLKEEEMNFLKWMVMRQAEEETKSVLLNQ